MSSCGCGALRYKQGQELRRTVNGAAECIRHDVCPLSHRFLSTFQTDRHHAKGFTTVILWSAIPGLQVGKAEAGTVRSAHPTCLPQKRRSLGCRCLAWPECRLLPLPPMRVDRASLPDPGWGQGTLK